MTKILDPPADYDFLEFYERLIRLLDLSEDHDGYSRGAEGGGRSGIAVVDDGILSFKWRTRTLGEATLIPWRDVKGVRFAVEFQEAQVMYQLSIDNPETKLLDSGDALRDVIRGIVAKRD